MKFWLAPLLLMLLCFDVQAARMDFNCEEHQDDDLAALACNIYWEGRNQSIKGMLAVAAVTMWRVADSEFPDTVAGVVWEKRFSKRHGRYYPQFQWTMDGKKDLPFVNEQKEWETAWVIARMFAVDAAHKARICPQIRSTQRMWDILEAMGSPVTRRPIACEAYETLIASKLALLTLMDPTDGSVMYHADYAKPAWRNSPAFHKVRAVDNHIFYRKKD